MTAAPDEQFDPEQGDFVSLGRFEARHAKRILKRLQEQAIAFRVVAQNEVAPSVTRYREWYWLVIYVYPADVERAGEIVRADARTI